MSLSPAQRYAQYKKRVQKSQTVAGQFAATLNFELDQFQSDAIDALENNHNVKAFYTTPIKALSNQKYHELVDQYGADRVGLLTGDLSLNSEADIVVMTTEVLRNMLYENSSTLNAMQYVILDEIHYLADRMRGAVWEEVIIHLPERVKIVGLSATVSNVEDFSAWIESIRSDTALVVSENRPVPLDQHVLLQAGPQKEPELYDLYDSSKSTATEKLSPQLLTAIDRMAQAAKKLRDRDLPKSKQYKRYSRSRFFQGKRGTGQNSRLKHYTPKRWAVVDELDYLGLLPGIYFIFSRNGCEKAVSQCLDAGLHLTTEAEARKIRSIVDEMTNGKLDKDTARALHLNRFRQALEEGFAAHHAGMVTLFRQIVEALFEQGLIKMVFATETLALGINMPARCVVVEKLEKFNGIGHVSLTPGEFTQLTGRAGRRGIDNQGHAIVVDHDGFVPTTVASLASKRVYPLHSSFAPTFNMAVNLLNTMDQTSARQTLDRSFAQWEANESAEQLASQLDAVSQALADYEEAFHCEYGNFKSLIMLRMQLTDLERVERRKLKHQLFSSESERTAAYKKIDAQIESLRQREKNHPCRSCPDLSQHMRWGHRWTRKYKEYEHLSNRYNSRTGSVSRKFDRICNVLLTLGYLQMDSSRGYVVTNKGELLRRIYSENDVVLAQTVSTGLLDNLTPQELACICSGFVYESRRGEGGQPRHFPGGSKGTIAITVSQILSLDAQLHNLCEDYELEPTTQLDFGMCEIMFNWVSEKPLTDVLWDTDLTGGDFVRNCKRTMDILGQIATIADYTHNTYLRDSARSASDIINHGIVAYSGIEND